MWRCLRGAPASASSQDLTVPAYGSMEGLRLSLATGGAGEKSPLPTYLATVFLLMPRLLAISLPEHPLACISRMHL